jgi:hypothetical protein
VCVGPPSTKYVLTSIFNMRILMGVYYVWDTCNNRSRRNTLVVVKGFEAPVRLA